MFQKLLLVMLLIIVADVVFAHPALTYIAFLSASFVVLLCAFEMIPRLSNPFVAALGKICLVAMVFHRNLLIASEYDVPLTIAVIQFGAVLAASMLLASKIKKGIVSR